MHVNSNMDLDLEVNLPLRGQVFSVFICYFVVNKNTSIQYKILQLTQCVSLWYECCNEITMCENTHTELQEQDL